MDHSESTERFRGKWPARSHSPLDFCENRRNCSCNNGIPISPNISTRISWRCHRNTSSSSTWCPVQSTMLMDITTSTCSKPKTVVSLPNTRSTALQQVRNLKKKPSENREFQRKCRFHQWPIEKGICCRGARSSADLTGWESVVYPLPCVVPPTKEVFQGAASFQEATLTKELLQGPNLTNS